MSEANTIWVKAYNTDGEPMNITFGFEDGKLIHADEIKRRVLEAGYLLTLPGAKPGEHIEVITHVMKRMQFNKRDGSTTPAIGFYHESPGLVFAYWNHYLNKPEDIAEFEAATGIKIADMPLLEDAAFPKRDDHFKQKYLVALQPSVNILVTKEPYTKEDGTEGTRVKSFEGFVSSSKPAPAQPPPPASGNAGQSVDPNKMVAPDENTWKRWVFDASKFLYTVGNEYNEFQHKNSLKKRMEDTGEHGINATMTLYDTLNRLIRYRGLVDLFIESAEYGNVFGMTLEDYVNKFDHVRTWQRMNEHFAAQLEPATTKKAS